MKTNPRFTTDPALVAFWDFQGKDWLVSEGPQPVRLQVRGIEPRVVTDGFWGSQALHFEHEGELARSCLVAPHTQFPWMCLGGPSAQVTVLAWVKRDPSTYDNCQFIAGVWNEHGRRQYGMFLNLRIWDAHQQLCAHVSHHGGATPGYPYCMDVAIGNTPVPSGQWSFLAITYDGIEARSYLNGALDTRGAGRAMGENPFYYPGGLSESTADFTIGSVERPSR